MAKTPSILALLVAASLVSAHGHVSNIVVNGVYYQNYDPTSFPYIHPAPVVIGWTYSGSDNGFVTPDAFGTPDIICHKNATAAQGHAVVAAGDKISIAWTPWPNSHHGPVINYLAACNGPCANVDKTALQFFKIDGAGYVSGADPGLWASDTLVGDNSTWLVQIPADLAPGYYVLRHEIIALHAAGSANGAQAYPQCINLQVTGGGSNKPTGVLGTKLYGANDPGILYNIYQSPLPAYTVPGPALIAGASSSIAQSSSAATKTATAVPDGSGGASTGVTTPTSVPATTTKVASSSSTTVVRSTSSLTAKPTTLSTATTKAPATTSAPVGGSGSVAKYGQCGGSGYTGATACAAGSTCSTVNAFYFQCV